MSKIKVLSLLLGGICAGVLVWSNSMDAHAQPPDIQLQEAQRAYKRFLPSLRNRRYIVLVDYTKPVFTKRLWIVDMVTKQPVLSAHVTQTYNSGIIYPTRFSNQEGSELSSTGSFITQGAYMGSYGRAMRLVGVDASNSHALQRSIVFHTARYPFFSRACFATSRENNKRIIELMEGGGLVYVAR